MAPSTNEPLVTGNGTCKVSMINTGFLIPSRKQEWIDTKEEEEVHMPVMAFVIEKDGKCLLWDLGLPEDSRAVVEQSQQDQWNGRLPETLRPLPASLSPSQLENLTTVYLSHYHWDHCGDPSAVPDVIPIFVGNGTLEGIRSGGLGRPVGNKGEDYISRLQDLPLGDVKVNPAGKGALEGGVDIFGDGSFIIVPAPGHCDGHQVAICRVETDPDAYIVLAGDSGHNQALYVPCTCHSRTAVFPPRQTLHRDVQVAAETLKTMTSLHEREDTWVILAHEYEAVGIVPEDEDLSGWKEKGWKGKIAGKRRQEDERSCFVTAG